MSTATAARVAVLAGGAFFGHVVYPLLVHGLAAVRPAPPRVATRSVPGERYVTAVVPAYKEVTTVGRLVEQLLHSPGSPVAEVIAVVDDDAETAAVARAAGAVVLEGPRSGKSQAVNRGVAHASHDVVLLLDANVDVETDDLARLCAHVASGELAIAGGVRTESGRASESMYWAFDNATKKAEDRLGGSLSLVGEVIALRKEHFRPMPEWVRADDIFLAVDFASRGLPVSVDTTCVSREPSVSPREQLERRFRIGEANLELLLRRYRDFLSPRPALLMLFAHRSWRSTGGPICQVALVVLALRHARRSPLAAGWAAVNLASVADYLVCSLLDREQSGRVRGLLGQAVGMPPVVFTGSVVRLVRRRRAGHNHGVWDSVAR